MSTKSLPKKGQLSEESIEAKQRGTLIEATSINDETKALMNETVKSAWDNMIMGSGTSIIEQLMGGGSDLHEGQAVSLKKQAEAKPEQPVEKKPVVSMEHMEYFRTVNNADRITESNVEIQMKQSVDQIRIEIQKLIKTSKIVERTVKDATADKAPVKPGKYHISFFEFVLSVLRDATRKLEDTASLGAVFTSKKQQSKYWNSYKTHGTSFGLSS